MSPRKSSQKTPAEKTVKDRAGPGMDRARHLEDARHHPADHPLPHPPHKAIKKPLLPKKHTPHSHPHGEELGPHTGRPGPVAPAKRVTRTGTKH